MLYECLCGFSSTTATAFYRHISQSKDSLGAHQLVQASLSERAPNAPKAPLPQENPFSSIFRVPVLPTSTIPKNTPISTSITTTNPESLGRSTSSNDPSIAVVGQVLRHRTSRPADSLDEKLCCSDEQEIDCNAIRGRLSPDKPQGPAGLQGGILWASSVLSSFILSAANPIVLFGLTEESGASGASSSSDLDSKQPDHSRESTKDERDANGTSIKLSPSYESRAKEYISAAEAIILWRDPWKSIRVLGLGLYLFLCMRQLFVGSLLIQPVTLCLGIALLYLLANIIKSFRMRTLSAMKDADNMATSHLFQQAHQDLQVYSAVHRMMQAVASWVIPAISSIAVLIHKALSGRHLVTSVLVGAFLWFGMLLGELGLVSSLNFTIVLYLAGFSLPAFYVRSREGLDVMVEDVIRLILRLLLRSTSSSMIWAAASALVLFVWAQSLGFVIRLSASLGASLVVLLWLSKHGASQL